MAVGLHKTGITSAYREAKTYDKRQMRPDGKPAPSAITSATQINPWKRSPAYITTSLAIDICGCPFAGC